MITGNYCDRECWCMISKLLETVFVGNRFVDMFFSCILCCFWGYFVWEGKIDHIFDVLEVESR